MFSDPSGEIGEALEGISIPGDQLPLAGLDVRKRPEAIDLQL